MRRKSRGSKEASNPNKLSSSKFSTVKGTAKTLFRKNGREDPCTKATIRSDPEIVFEPDHCQSIAIVDTPNDVLPTLKVGSLMDVQSLFSKMSKAGAVPRCQTKISAELQVEVDKHEAESQSIAAVDPPKHVLPSTVKAVSFSSVKTLFSAKAKKDEVPCAESDSTEKSKALVVVNVLECIVAADHALEPLPSVKTGRLSSSVKAFFSKKGKKDADSQDTTKSALNSQVVEQEELAAFAAVDLSIPTLPASPLAELDVLSTGDQCEDSMAKACHSLETQILVDEKDCKIAAAKKISVELLNEPDCEGIPKGGSPSRPSFVVIITTLNVSNLEGSEAVYDFLHHPSYLDVRKHQRYGLILAVHNADEKSLLSHLHATLIVNPRCLLGEPGCECKFVSVLVHTSPAVVVPRLLEEAPSSSSLPTSLSSGTQPENDDPSPASPAPGPLTMTLGDLSVLGLLGEGTSGKVYTVKHRVVKKKLALKVIAKKGKTPFLLNMIVQERNTLEKLSGLRFFVNLWGASHDRDNLYLVMEHYPTDLDTEMIRCDRFDIYRARFYAAELYLALLELHRIGIIHRDLKAPNILIDKDGHIVLADFGLSKDFQDQPNLLERVCQPYYPYLREDPPTPEYERDPEELVFVVTTEFCGSELEMAPEVHMGQPYSFGVDFYSFAVILYWMLCGRPPFYLSESEIDDPDAKPLVCRKAEDPLLFDDDVELDDVAEEFLDRMLEKNPASRLRACDIPEHPFFAPINWRLIKDRKVPVPWIPTQDDEHTTEPTEPIFTPGELYSDVHPDSRPDFFFLSEQPLLPVDSEIDVNEIDEHHFDSVPIDEEDAQADVSIVDSSSSSSFVEHSFDSRYEGRLPVVSTSVMSLDYLLVYEWDVTVVSPPSAEPCHPGPKAWFNAQDLRQLSKTLLASESTFTLSPVPLVASPTGSELECALPEEEKRSLLASESTFTLSPIPLVASPTVSEFECAIPEEEMRLESDGHSRFATVNHYINPTPSSFPDISTYQPVLEAVDHNGLLSRFKLWASKIRVPKFKKVSRLRTLFRNGGE